MAEKPAARSTPAVLRSAGRKALSVLRHTRRRAKLGTLHLPLDLHPLRQDGILLPLAASEPLPARPESGAAALSPAAEDSRRPGPSEETRALRSRLGVAERRILRLRQALERERAARAQAATALARPGALIDHLVADLSRVASGDTEALRQTIVQVLGAYGFAAAAGVSSGESARQIPDDLTPPALPGWDRQRLQAVIAQILARHPETGARYVILGLKALLRQRAVTPAAIATEAGLTSALARHRLRVALDGLCAAGIARREGQRFSLASQQQPGTGRAPRP